jgi:hypothetical protein
MYCATLSLEFQGFVLNLEIPRLEIAKRALEGKISFNLDFSKLKSLFLRLEHFKMAAENRNFV